MSEPQPLLAVRATVHLPNPHGPTLPPGGIACVDPERPYIRECLAQQLLVALPQSQQGFCEEPAG